LSFFDISHDVLDVSDESGEVWFSRLDLGKDIFGIGDNVLNIFHAGWKVIDFLSLLVREVAVIFSSFDISGDGLSIFKDSGDINFAGFNDFDNIFSSSDETLNVFQALSHISYLTDLDHLLFVVGTILTDVGFDNLDNFDGSSIGDIPVTSVDFVVDSVTDVTNSVPIRFAHVVELASSFDPENSVLKFSRKVLGTFGVFVTNTGNETLKGVLHDPFSFFALFWVWWSWVIITVFLGFTKYFNHSVKGILGMVPITGNGVVQSPFSDVLDVVHVHFALTLKMASFFEHWHFLDQVGKFSFSSLLVLGLDGSENLVNISFEVLSISFALIWFWSMLAVTVSLMEDLEHIFAVSISLVPVTFFSGFVHSLGETVDHPEIFGTFTRELALFLQSWHVVNDVFESGFSGILVVSFDIINHFLNVLHHSFDVGLALIFVTDFLENHLGVRFFTVFLVMLFVTSFVGVMMAVGTSSFEALFEDHQGFVSLFPVFGSHNGLKSCDHTFKGIEIFLAHSFHVAVSFHGWKTFFEHLSFLHEMFRILFFGRLHHVLEVFLEHLDVTSAFHVWFWRMMAVFSGFLENSTHGHEGLESVFPVTLGLQFHHFLGEHGEHLGVLHAFTL